MSECFLGEIRPFAFDYAPLGWAFCNGQSMSIPQNSALYSLLSIQFGGDGRTNFNLPNLMGRIPMGQGSGPGLTPRGIGQAVGDEQVTLNANQLPPHTHQLQARDVNATQPRPQANALAKGTIPGPRPQPYLSYGSLPTPDAPMAAQAISATGGGQSHENRQPVLGLNYCIALTGIYPSRG